MLILPLIISFNSFGQRREASTVKPGVLAPPIEEPLEPLPPGECTPENEGRDGLWRFRSVQTQTGNVSYFWLGRNPNEIPLSSFWVGINKSSPASVLDVHYPDNRSASARLGLSVTTGNCNAVGLVAGDRFPGWVGSYVASGEFPFGSPFQIRAGIADGGVWDPSSGTFIHLDPEKSNIGINNSNPSSTLDVRGDVHASSDIRTDQNLHVFQGANVGYGDLTSTVPNGLSVAGRVGIGTLNPLAPLQIGDVNTFYSNNQFSLWGRNWNVNNNGSPIIDGRSSSFLVTDEAGTLRFANRKAPSTNEPNTQPVDRFFISPNGNVGIGTSLPTSRVTISDIAGGDARIVLDGPNSIHHGLDIKEGPLNKWFVGQRANTSDFVIDDGNPANSIRLLSNGKVVIGAKMPGSTNLFQNWKLAVDGLINSKEVVVTPINTWADYVFEEGYQLPDLMELEKQLKAEKHLPGIPTAQEVKENGIQLGELQVELVKKIEELTLLLIEQKKEIEALKKKIK